MRVVLLLAVFLLLSAPGSGDPPYLPAYQGGTEGGGGHSRREQARSAGLEARMMWFDATANLERLSTRAGVADVLDKCVRANINAVAVGVKTSCGFILHKSEIAPRMRNFQGKVDYPEGYDLLETVLEEGHKRGLRVYAMLMVFSEGRLSDRTGPAYTKFPEWQSVYYDVGVDGKPGIFPSAQARTGTFVFLNPVLPEVRRYELSIIEEILRNYKVDGIVIDRCRYDGVRADFSESSRKAFEQHIGRKLKRFPEDICEMKPSKSGYKHEPGLLYKEWLEWRATVIGSFVAAAAAVVRSLKPGASFGSVVGAWYPEYAPEGANWASRGFRPETRYSWATPSYHKSGYAEHLDFLVPNCYGRTITEDEPRSQDVPYWWTIQGGARMANEVTMDACYVYAGIYVKHFEHQPEKFLHVLQIAVQDSSGVKIFDLSQVEEYGWWPIIGRVFSRPAGLPHESR